MGFLFSKIIELFSRSKNNFKILILGIQNAGKTTILYRLSIGQHIKTSPTIGSNCEEIAFNNGWISKMQLLKSADEMIKNEYGQYLFRLYEKDNQSLLS